ncbi:hypothetical protein [Rhodococcus sp. YH1]|uniref:hypothetical protein n=1 Tax=Rhodococcus sp. YH1 TaxID=89066 RepID=UPI001386B666|nr:hypothetical protein [Rhodococcus sp. YH1]NCL78918.1 hypothetical protein [Rhodococcus sp. YH1]
MSPHPGTVAATARRHRLLEQLHTLADQAIAALRDDIADGTATTTDIAAALDVVIGRIATLTREDAPKEGTP